MRAKSITRAKGAPATSGRPAVIRHRPPQPRSVHPAIVEALSSESLVSCLVARRADGGVALTMESLDDSPTTFTGAQLVAAAEGAARRLRKLGLEPGGRVILLLPTSSDFVFLFWGTLLAGGTTVPAYPPVGWSQLAAFADTLARMVTVTAARIVIVPGALRDVLEQAVHRGLRDTRIVTPEEVWEETPSEDLPLAPTADDIALIQFSSGSTGEPRGICLSHRNVVSNARTFAERMRLQPSDVAVSWLPLYHDMGLIGTMIAPLACRIRLVLLPPTDFLRQPGFWLRTIGKYGATITVAPQFAYSLCLRKVDVAALKNVDLSPLRILLNGAEPIQADAIDAFERRFRALGLRRNVVTPCYGLGEATLAVCMAVPGRKMRVDTAQPENTLGSRKAASGTAGTIVSVGPPLIGTEVRIVGANDEVQPDGAIGEVCVRGPSVCHGYLTAGGTRQAVDAEGWLHTGDLGFLSDGELFVTGRKKDLIIIGGRNLYPQDLEEEACKLPGLRAGRVTAFGVSQPNRGTQALVLVAETNGQDLVNPARSASELRQRLLQRFGVNPYDIVLVGRGQIPVTTSGKLRRFEARSNYQRDSFSDVVYRLRPSAVTATQSEARGA